jgi:hypothetical protein
MARVVFDNSVLHDVHSSEARVMPCNEFDSDFLLGRQLSLGRSLNILSLIFPRAGKQPRVPKKEHPEP